MQIGKMIRLTGLLVVASTLFTACTTSKGITTSGPLIIQEQGSFTVGGSMITSPGAFDPYKPTPAGQTFRGDHAYVFYQLPVQARKYPLPCSTH